MYVATSYTHTLSKYTPLCIMTTNKQPLTLAFFGMHALHAPLTMLIGHIKSNYYRHLVYKHEVIQDVCQYVAIVHIAKDRFLHSIATQ